VGAVQYFNNLILNYAFAYRTQSVYDPIMNMTLKQYISKYGDSLASEKLSINPRSAAAYRRGERMPRSKDIPKLIQRSKGELCFSSFFIGDDL